MSDKTLKWVLVVLLALVIAKYSKGNYASVAAELAVQG